MHRFNFWHFHLFCISQYRKGLPLARGPLRCGAQFGLIGLKPALGELLYNICCRMQPFIKQMCGSARKFNANTRTNIKRLSKQPNLLLNIFNFGVGFLAFAISNFSSKFLLQNGFSIILSILTSIPLI